MSLTHVIFEAHKQNQAAYWDAVNAKIPFVAFGGAEMELIRFNNVPECPFNHHGFVGREWFKSLQQFCRT